MERKKKTQIFIDNEEIKSCLPGLDILASSFNILTGKAGPPVFKYDFYKNKTFKNWIYPKDLTIMEIAPEKQENKYNIYRSKEDYSKDMLLNTGLLFPISRFQIYLVITPLFSKFLIQWIQNP